MRKQDWEERLNAFLEKHITSAELDFGQFDCALGLATGAVKAMTGKDIGREFRGKYNSAIEGHKLLLKKGYKSLEAAMSAKLEEKPVAFAQRGDVVLYQGCLGVCVGAQSVFMPAETEAPGLIRVDTLSCSKAWAV